MVTAKNWSIMDIESQKVIWQKEGHRKKEIASLTKIMTCFVTLHLCKKFSIDIYHVYFKVSKKASETIGTSAELLYGDKVI
jgi:serine-type D-Ala-D-Ala carboxypeptidase (penicillin-binding protein 5/6)